MRPSITREVFALLLMTVSVWLSGCGNDTFAPPPRVGSKADRPVAPVGAKEIVLILPAGTTEDLNMIADIGRIQAGHARAVFRLLQVGEGEPPTKQAELIKQAVSEGASVIVIVPNEAKETAEALAGVDQKKTPIVVLGRAIASTSGGLYPLLTWPAFGPSARLIVDAIVEDVKKASLPDDAPVLFVKTEPPDLTSAARDAALLDALKATKHPIAAIVPMGVDATAKTVLIAALKAHPKVCAIVCDDALGVSTATAIRIDMKDGGVYMIGGYCASQVTMKLVEMNQISVLVDRNLPGIVRVAIAAAIDRIEGKAVPEKTEIEMPTRRASGNTSKPVPLSP